MRETRGREVDLLVDQGAALRGVECKSGATLGSDALRGLHALADTLGPGQRLGRGVLVYGGEAA